MHRVSFLRKIISLMIGVLIVAPWLTSVSAGGLKFPQPPVSNRKALFGGQQLFADFDGDKSIDEADLSETGRYKDIEIYLGGFREESITFDSGRSEPGRLVSGDIDHDHDQDLVWYSQTDSRSVFFCLNNGRGIFGPATRYQPSAHQADLDLNPRLDRETESQIFGHPPGGGTDCALRADDPPAVETAAGRETTTSSFHNSREEIPSVRSIYLNTVFERGPPAASLNSGLIR